MKGLAALTMMSAALMAGANTARSRHEQDLMDDFIDKEFPVRRFKERAPKNKYNLTPEEVEAMASLTPKEKKKFLKERNNG